MTRLMSVLLVAVLVSTNILGILILVPREVNAVEYISGSIGSDTTWYLVNSPYIIVDNVTVESGVTLTIEPGVEVKFNGSYSIIVNGTLNATGTSSLPINFTSNQTIPSKGDWMGIRLQGINNTLDYCQISYGVTPLIINGSNTNNSISNCMIFNNSGDGIYLNATTDNTFINVTISFNEGNGITILSSENSTILNSKIIQNKGSGVFLNTSMNSRIEDTNISYNSQDAIYLEESIISIIKGNILYNNNGTGINLTSSSSNNAIEKNNITFNNKTGIFIVGTSNSNIISRNHIANNTDVGVNITGSTGNQVHHNNLDSNGKNAYDSTNQLNFWDNGFEGNWWSDYTGSDGDGDGIGDTPHNITGGDSKDYYPLVNPVNISAPIIEDTIPDDGTENVSVDPQISITFSDEMNKTATENATSMSGGATPTNFTWSNGNQTLTFEPSLTLDSETTYNVTISTDAKDLLGYHLQLEYQFSFITEDVIAPEITLTSPANDTINVAINTDVIVTFNETMNTSTVTYTCSPDPGGWTPSWSNGNKTVTYSHDAFASETLYTFNVTGGKDLAGNDLVVGPVPNPWIFTTEDVIGPEINSTSPSNGTIDVLITADIVVNFTEGMNTSSVTYTCDPNPGGWTPSWSNGNQTVTYSHDPFESETLYTFNITGGKDVAGNNLVAGAVPNPWEFTTEDVLGPQITITSPANGTIDVLITADVIVTFSEEMNTSTVTYTCNPNPLGWSVVWSGGNTTVTYSHNDFNSTTTYTFEINGGKDVAGNDLVTGSVPNPWSFTTEDVEGPQISSTTPSNGTIDVLISANIVVNFNEEMNTSSVTYTCTPDPGGWTPSWSNGNQTVTYSHNAFAGETTYTFNITGAKDIAGNDLVAGAVPNPWEFTTEDVLGPKISSTSPVNASIDVPVNADVVVTFNESMNTSSVTFTCNPDPGGWSFIWSGGNTTVTYSHNGFNSNTSYTFEITGGKDEAGNDLVAGAVPNPWTFSTEDIEGPKISSTIPSNGTFDILINADIMVYFDEEMNISSVTYTCNPDPGGWTPTWSNGNQTVTYTHNVFDSETTYTFEVTGGKDLAGNDLVAGTVPNPWEFTTEDVIPPEITITSPINNTIDVLIATAIIVTFSEEMNTSSVIYTCTPDPGSWIPSWSNGNQTVTYSHNDFASETQYTFNITGAKDTAGNDLVAGVVPNPWIFTTEDVIGPEISSTTPSDGSIDVLIPTDIVAIFSEEMNTSSITYTCTPDPGGWSFVWSGGNTTVTYSHNDFNSTTLYIFEITGGKDAAGNNLAAGAVPNPWTFTTEDVIEPKISSTTPSNGAIDVLITANIVITFSEEMNTSSVTYTCIPDPGGWAPSWSNGNKTISYSHNDFGSETLYTFNITGAKDVAGNDLVAGIIPNPWIFVTEDVVGPVISSTFPTNGAIDVFIYANIVITFSEEMNTSSVTYTCSPDPGGWTPSWSNGNQTVTYSHNDFASETLYTFNITGGKDISGNDLIAGPVPNPWEFTTEDVIPPEITATQPINDTTNALITADIVVTFSEEMNTSSITYTCTPDPGGWSVIWSGGNTTATYSHNQFSEKTEYTFQVTGGKDDAGNVLTAGAVPNPWSFKTEDITAPQITATLPTNGSIDILLSTDAIVTFNEEMNISSVSYTCTPDPGGWIVVWSGSNTTATYSHNPFSSTTLYTFQITGAKDLAGNDLVAGAVPNPWAFTTEDAQSPTIIFTSPVDGSTNVLQTANIVVTFSEAMDTSSVNYACSPNPGGWFLSWGSGDTEATFSHNPFDSYTSYTFQITGGRDLAGNNLVSGPKPNPWSFTTIDSISPSITVTSPSDGQVNVGLIQNIVVTFSEEMNTSSLSYNCFPDPGGWIVSWSSDNSVVTFSHDAFDDSTEHTFQIANAKDIAGNFLVIGGLPNPWTFTTIDTTSPTVIATSPPNSSTDIALSANIVVTFSEEMNTATVTYLCIPDPDGWSVSWNAQNTIATYSHNTFDELTTYSFQIVSGEDIMGNDLTVVSVPNPWSFTTEDITLPKITATTPYDGNTGIGLIQEVIITFSEPMDNTTLTYTCLPDLGGWMAVWSGSNTVATYSHNPFDSRTTYTFQVTGGKDMSGNDLVAGVTPNPWSFSTVDSISPTITLTSPSNGAIDISLGQDISITFSEAMNTSSIAYTCSPNPGGWTISWSSGNTVATFTHNTFEKSTVYTFQILNIKDVAGNSLVSSSIPNPWSFTTVANTPPTILSSPITSGTEDTQYTYDVVAQDNDGDTLTYTLTTYPTGMMINITNGLITWTPTNSQVGAHNVVVLVTDGDFGADSQSFIITVANVNDPPAIISSPITMATEDVQYTYDVDATDIDGDTLTFSLSTYPAGMVIDNITGFITWTPVNSQVGTNNVYVLVSDGKGGFDTQSFSITVTNTNDPPTITSVPITSATEDTLYIYDVEASDVDAGDTLTYSLTTFPTGMVINTTTGVISWTPSNEQVGSHNVVIFVSDGNGGNDTESFTLVVMNTNDAPTIISTPITTATEEVQYTYDVEATDIDGDTLDYELSTYPSGMAIDNTSGLITWTPTNAQAGINNIVVLVLDGKGGSDTQSFSINVTNTNDAPIIISIPITTATEDELYFYDVDATDEDMGDTLTYSLTEYPTGMTINTTSGVISWTPTNAQVGTSSVTVVVSDGNGGSDTQPFSITVSNVNDPPTIGSTPITTATEDSQYAYDVEGIDVDVWDVLSYSLTTYPSGMTIDSSTGLILWTPTNDQVGVHSVVVLVSDGKGGNNTQSFSISVTNTNDPPTITSTPIITATDDMMYTYYVEASDVDVGDTLTYSLTAYPTGMTIDAITGLIEWTPTDDHVGSNGVTVLVSDGNGGTDTQSYSISVANANDPPTITSTAIIKTTEDTGYSYNVDALDPDDDILTFSLTTSPIGMTIDSATGLILWTPTNDQVGSNNVVVRVLDGNGGSDTQSFTITVTNTNDQPTITSAPIITATEDLGYSYYVEASDVDIGDILTYGLTTYPMGMSINTTTGSITWIPTNNQVGLNEVVILVSDGNGGKDTQSFSITVSNTNDAPTIISTPVTAATEDMVYYYKVNATDMDIGDSVTYSLTTYPDSMVIDIATGVITWTPTNDDVGSNSVTVKVIDGNGGTTTQSFYINVKNVNDKPTINSQPIETATQDSLYTYNVEANDVDSGDTLTYSLSVYPTGMVINSSIGEISWTPMNSQVGERSVTVWVLDLKGEKDSQSFVITVANMNDPPTFTSTPITTATEEIDYFYEVEAFDIDSDTLTFSLLNYPNGMAINSVDGTITWIPTNAQVGTHSIIIKVTDGNTGEARQSFTISVENVNDEPTITSTPLTKATEEEVYAYQVQAEDIDLTNDILTYELATVYPQGMQMNSTSGIISWTPTNAQVGNNRVIVIVTDGKGGKDNQSFVIEVSNVNDAPSITSTPITTATEEVQYIYDVQAKDVDFGDTLNYTLTSAPSGMSIEELTGIITWTPTDAQVGTHQIIVMVMDNQSAYVTQSFTITVKNVNDSPIMYDYGVVPETGNNKEKFVFTLMYQDPDGDEGTVKVIIDGKDYEMNQVGGDAVTGAAYSLEMTLSARNHTYYFEIDDDEGHIVVSEVFKISVSAAEVAEKEEADLLPIPIPQCWVILILLVIVVVVLIYLFVVKGQLKKERRSQFLEREEQKRKFEELERERFEIEERSRKASLEKAKEKIESDEPLLEFTK